MDVRRLTLHQLRVFMRVARRLNFTRAAEDLHLSQSAVSVQVKELTELLGVPLFDHVGKRIFVTEAGRVLMEQASRVEAVIDEIDGEFLARRGGERGGVRVGGSTSIGTYFLPALVAAFTSANPKIDVLLEIENTEHVESRLLLNEFDIAFTGGNPKSGEIITEPFLDDEIFFAASPGHPLAAARSIDIASLRNEKIFVREAGSATRRAMDDFFAAKGVVFEKRLQLGSAEAIKQAVMAGLGIACLSSLTVGREIEEGRLLRLPVRGAQVRRNFYLLKLRRKGVTPALKKFTDFARKYVP